MTPPVSPTATSLSSFGSQYNGIHSNGSSKSFNRQLSEENTEGVDGSFKYLEKVGSSVFTIAGNQTDTLKSNRSQSPKSGYDNGGFDSMGSNFSVDKYKYTDSDGQTNSDTKTKKGSKRKICITVLVTSVVILIVAAITVIVSYFVFNGGGKKFLFCSSSLKRSLLNWAFY